MSTHQKHHTTSALRMLARKGTYDVFMQIKERNEMHYNEVLHYALEKQIIKSRASITTILNDLTYYGLLDRIVVQPRPTRVKYAVNDTGLQILKHLEEIEKIFKKESRK